MYSTDEALYVYIFHDVTFIRCTGMTRSVFFLGQEEKKRAAKSDEQNKNCSASRPVVSTVDEKFSGGSRL